jgi:hypothetical protein
VSCVVAQGVGPAGARIVHAHIAHRRRQGVHACEGRRRLVCLVRPLRGGASPDRFAADKRSGDAGVSPFVEDNVAVIRLDAHVGIVVHVADELPSPLLTKGPSCHVGIHGVGQAEREDVRCLGSIICCPSLRLSESGALDEPVNNRPCQIFKQMGMDLMPCGVKIPC